MTEEELEKLVASVTPERLRSLMLTAWGTLRLGRRTAVPMEALLQGLTAGVDPGEGEEFRRVRARLREAIITTVRAMPDTRYAAGT